MGLLQVLGEVHQHDLLAGGGLVSLAARVEAVLLRQRGAGAGLGAPPLPPILATILGILKRDLDTGITIRVHQLRHHAFGKSLNTTAFL